MSGIITSILAYCNTVGQKILKSPGQKNSSNQINQFHAIFFDQIPTGKKFKTAKNAISRNKIFDLFDFTSFFAWTFLNFLARFFFPYLLLVGDFPISKLSPRVCNVPL